MGLVVGWGPDLGPAALAAGALDPEGRAPAAAARGPDTAWALVPVGWCCGDLCLPAETTALKQLGWWP
ncbi:MAG: hypothetical protein ACRDRG_20945 [Pseudonocardiaceae bacterium]